MIVISRTLHKDRVGHGKETGGEERGGGTAQDTGKETHSSADAQQVP